MNSSGMIRGYMSKSCSAERFLIHVGTCMEDQMQQWDETYGVNIMKFTDYVFVVKNVDNYYEMKLSEDEVEMLKNKGPYALDRKIWSTLQEQGLPILEGYGDYISKVWR